MDLSDHKKCIDTSKNCEESLEMLRENLDDLEVQMKRNLILRGIEEAEGQR